MSEFPNQPNFKVLEKLGQGAFGAAYKVLNLEDNSTYVIKKILLKNATEEEIKEIKNEANILASLDSENIVKYYDSFSDNNSFNIIMEYCDGLDLRKYLNDNKKSNELIKKEIIIHIILGICNGLKYIHSKKLIHRDLKPDNIFLNADMKVKIGDFGIARQLKSENEYAKTQAGTMLYMAPEIIKEGKYNNKVDVWSLGCIIQELCTLNFCFNGRTIIDLIDKITKGNHERINKIIYGEDMQNLIDSLLNINYKNRPNIDEVIKIINRNIGNSFINKIVELFQEDKSYQNYALEKNILNSINQVQNSINKKENKFLLLALNSINTVHQIFSSTVFTIFSMLNIQLFSEDKFLRENKIILEKLQENLMVTLRERLDKNLLKEKIIIFNKQNLDNKITEIKIKLLENENIKRLQKIVTKNFNILLVGCTNAGKSTLINEFLKLKGAERAKESTGGPTDTEDFKPYKGIINHKRYTLYDTNGITNMGEDSIESKQKNTIAQIEKRLKSHDPNELIHCIWYCFQGSNVQPSDKMFIESLLNIYTTYTIPIIYIHTQTYSKKQSNTCKLGIEKYLNEIYKNDRKKVQQQLNNYINILARGDEEEEREAFGLVELEKLSQKEIEIKGIKSSYFEYIKQDIIPILINGVFNLIFTEYNIEQLRNSRKSLENLLNTMLSIVNNDKLGLSEDIKSKNKESLFKLCNSFKNLRNDLKDNLMESLTMSKLKNDNLDFIKDVYDNRNESYKKEISFQEFCELVEDLIYDNFINNKKEIINNFLNYGFIFFNLEIIKEGIKEQFKEIEVKILSEIYTEIFKVLNKN